MSETPVFVRQAEKRELIIAKLKGMVGQYVQDLDFLAKAHASDYATRRHREVLAFLEEVKNA